MARRLPRRGAGDRAAVVAHRWSLNSRRRVCCDSGRLGGLTVCGNLGLMSCCVWSWTHLLHSCAPSLQLRVWRELTSRFGIVVRGVECSAPHRETKPVMGMSSNPVVFSPPPPPQKTLRKPSTCFPQTELFLCVSAFRTHETDPFFFGKQDTDHFRDFWIEKPVTPEKAFVWHMLYPRPFQLKAHPKPGNISSNPVVAQTRARFRRV